MEGRGSRCIESHIRCEVPPPPTTTNRPPPPLRRPLNYPRPARQHTSTKWPCGGSLTPIRSVLPFPAATAGAAVPAGFDEFRGSQLDAILAAISSRDSFVLMPTGGGKSLCYALVPAVRQGLVLVVSPLIALMQDQVQVGAARSGGWVGAAEGGLPQRGNYPAFYCERRQATRWNGRPREEEGGCPFSPVSTASVRARAAALQMVCIAGRPVLHFDFATLPPPPTLRRTAPCAQAFCARGLRADFLSSSRTEADRRRLLADLQQRQPHTQARAGDWPACTPSMPAGHQLSSPQWG
jgi:hypothetical protein